MMEQLQLPFKNDIEKVVDRLMQRQYEIKGRYLLDKEYVIDLVKEYGKRIYVDETSGCAGYIRLKGDE